jgi:alkylated DNA repair dioxygenase AlkB
MSNIELSSRGLSTTETGEVIISNKSKFNKFVKTYKENANKITSEPNLQSDLQIIDSIEEGISLTVNELDVLFKYIYDPYGIEVKQGEKISKIKGPGIYVTFANSNGDIYSFDINNNLATTNPTGGQIKVLSTLNTPYSSEKNRFLDNFAAYVSEDLNLPYSMRFLELVEYYKQINPDVEDVDIILSVKDVNGNSKTFTLAEINELDDSLLQSELNHPAKQLVKDRIDRDLEQYKLKKLSIISNEKNNEVVLEDNYSISDGHILKSNKERALDEVFGFSEIDQIRVNTTKRAGEKKVTGRFGSKLSFDSPDGQYVPSPTTRTGQVTLLTTNKDYINVKPRKLDEDEANLVLDIILIDFGKYLDGIDTRFKKATKFVDVNGNPVEIPSQYLVRYENLKNMSISDYPLISKLIFFSGKNPESELWKDWDISVEKNKEGRLSNKNYLHFGQNSIAISDLVNDIGDSRDTFINWAVENLNHIVNDKELNNSSQYIHPIDISLNEDTQQVEVTVDVYDSYSEYLYNQQVLTTDAVSIEESNKLGFNGQLNVGKYISIPREATVFTELEDKGKSVVDPTPTQPQQTEDNVEEDTDVISISTKVSDLQIGKVLDITYQLKIGDVTFEYDVSGVVTSDNITYQGKTSSVKYIHYDRSSFNIYRLNENGDRTKVDDATTNLLYENLIVGFDQLSVVQDLIDGNNPLLNTIPLQLLVNSVDNQVIASNENFTIGDIFSENVTIDAPGITGLKTVSVSEVKPQQDVAKDTDTEESEEPTISTPTTVSELIANISIADSKLNILDSVSKTWKDTKVVLNPNYEGYAKFVSYDGNEQIVIGTKFDGTSKNSNVPIISIPKKDLENIEQFKKETIIVAKELNSNYDNPVLKFTLKDGTTVEVKKGTYSKNIMEYYKNTEVPLGVYADYELFNSPIRRIILKSNNIKHNSDGSYTFEGTFSLKENEDLATPVVVTIKGPSVEDFIQKDKKLKDTRKKLKEQGVKSVMDDTRGLSASAQLALNELTRDVIKGVKNTLSNRSNKKGLSDAKKSDILLHEIIHKESYKVLNKYKNRPSGTPGYISNALDDIDIIRGKLINRLIDNKSGDYKADNRTLVNLLGYKYKKYSNQVNKTLDALKSKKDKDVEVTFDTFITELKNNMNDHMIVDEIKTSYDEFVASIFEDKDFIDLLSSIPSDKENTKVSLFQDIIKALRELFNLDVKANNLFNRSISNASVLLSEPDMITAQQLEIREQELAPKPKTNTQSPNSETVEDTKEEDDDFDFSGLGDDSPEILDDSGDELFEREYPAEESNNVDDQKSINEISKYLETSFDHKNLLKHLGQDYDLLATSLALSGAGDNIDLIIRDTIKEFIEAKQLNNEKAESDYDELFKNVFDKISDLVDNYDLSDGFTPIYSIFTDKNNMVFKNAPITLDNSEFLDLQEGISYFIFKEIINSKSNLDDKTINFAGLYKTSMISLANYLVSNNKSLSDYILNGINSDFKSKNGITEEEYDKIIKDHYSNHLVSYGYSVDLDNSDVQEDDNDILSLLPDYADKDKIDIKDKLPALIKIIIASVPQYSIQRQSLNDNKITSNQKALDLINGIKLKLDADQPITNRDRKILANIGKEFKIPNSSILTNKTSETLSLYELEIANNIVINTIPILTERTITKQVVKRELLNNDLGLPKLDDFGRVWNFLARKTADSSSDSANILLKLNSIVRRENIKPTNKGIHGLADIMPAFKNFSNFFDAADLSTTNSLLQALNNYETFHTIIIADNSGNIYETSANARARNRSIRQAWSNNIKLKVSKFNRSINIDNDNLTNLFVKRLSNILNSTPNKNQAAINVLDELGITFNDNQQALTELSNLGVNNLHRFTTELVGWIDNLIDSDPAKLFSSKSDDVSGKIATLVEAETLSDTDVVTNQFLNSQGETVYALQLYHTMSLLTSKLNEHVGNSAAILSKMPYYNDTYAQNSLLLKQLKLGNKINTVVVNGMRYNMSGESGQETSTLSFADQLSIRINSGLSGTFFIPQAADRKVFNAIQLQDNRLLFNSEQDIVEGFRGYLIDEINAIIDYKNNKDLSDFNNNEASTKLRFFGEILSPELVEDIYKRIEINPTKISNTDELPADFIKKVNKDVISFIQGKTAEFIEVLNDSSVTDRTPKIRGKGGKYFDKYVTDESTMESESIFQGISKDIYDKYSNGGTLSKKATLDEILKYFLSNQIGAYIEFTKLFSGDPAFYGNEDNFFKRMSMVNSTRKSTIVGNKIDKIFQRYSYVKAVETNGSISKLRDYQFRKMLRDGNIDPTTKYILGSGFRLDGKKQDSKFNSIIFNDVQTTSRYSNDDVTSIKISKDEIKYLDSKGKETSPSLYRKIFTEYFVNDLQFKDNDIVNIKVETLLAPYNSIDEADGQGYVTLDEYRELLIRVGDWTQEFEKVYFKALRGEELTVDELTYFNPLKTQYTGPLNLEGTNVSDKLIPSGYKHSVIPLLPSVIKGTQLEKLNDWMIANKVGLAQFKSANKFGTKTNNGKINDFYTEKDGKLEINPDNWDSNLIQSNYYEFYSIQVDNKPKLKRFITSGSQKRKLVLIDTYEFGVISEELKPLADEYINIQNALIAQEIFRLKLDLGVVERGNGLVITNYKKLIEILLDQARSRNSDQNIIDAINLLSSKIERPDQINKEGLFIDEISTNTSIENVLMALVRSRIITEKRPGESYPQAPSTGFEKERIKGDSLLKYYREDINTGNLLPAQVRVPLRPELYSYVDNVGGLDAFNRSISNLHKKLEIIRETSNDENIILTDKEEELLKLITIIGFRIPTQKPGNVGVYEIHSFLPPEVGNSAHVPPEIVAQMGSDMDFDKLTVEYPIVRTYGDKLNVLDFNNMDIVSEYYRYMMSKLKRNKKIHNRVKKYIIDVADADVAKLISDDLDLMFRKGELMADSEEELYRSMAHRGIVSSLTAYQEMMSQMLGVPTNVTEQIIKEYTENKGIDKEDIRYILEDNDYKSVISLSEMLLHDDIILDENMDISSLKSSTLYKAFIRAGGDDVDTFIYKMQNIESMESVPKEYLLNKMINLQKDLLLHKSKGFTFLSPVDNSALIGENGVVWKIRFLSSKEDWAVNLRNNYKKELTDLGNSYATNSRDYQLIKSDIQSRYIKSFIPLYKGENKGFGKIIDIKSNIDKAFAFLIGKSNIGIAARHTTHHSLSQIANLQVNTPIILTEDGNFLDNSNIYFDINYVDKDGNPLGMTRSQLLDRKNRVTKNGKFVGIKNPNGKIVWRPGEMIFPALGGKTSVTKDNILQTISAFLDAYVDVAKDPFIFDINAGKEVVSTYLYLIRLGADLNYVTMLLNQPAVVDYINESKKYKSNFKKIYKGIPSKASMVSTVLSKYEGSIYSPLLNTTEWYSLSLDERKEELSKLGLSGARIRNMVRRSKLDDYQDYIDVYNDWASKNVKMMYSRKGSAVSAINPLFKDPNEIHHTLHNRIKSGLLRKVLWTANDEANSYKYIPENVLEEGLSADNVDFATQKQALDMFLEYSRQAGILTQIMNASSQDTHGVSKTYDITKEYVENNTNVMSMKYMVNDRNLIDDTIVKSFDDAINFSINLYRGLFLRNSIPVIKAFTTLMKNDIGANITDSKKKEAFYGFFNSELMTFLLHTNFGDNVFVDSSRIEKLLTDSSNSRYKDLKTGESITLPTYINAINSSNNDADNQKVEKLRNNLFFRKLYIVGSEKDLEAVTSEYRTFSKNDDNLSIAFPVSKFTKVQRDKLIQEFRNIKKIDPTLYNDLVMAGLASYGLSGSPYSYVDLIPKEDITSLIVKQVNMFGRSHQAVIDTILNIFYNQFSSSHRTTKYMPSTNSMRFADDVELFPRKLQYLNTSINRAPMSVVKYTTDNMGNTIRKIFTNPVKSQSGSVYTQSRRIIGSNRWVGYNLNVNEDFVNRSKELYAQKEGNALIRKMNNLPKEFNLNLEESDRQQLLSGDKNILILNEDFPTKYNVDNGRHFVVVINNKPITLKYLANVSPDKIYNSELSDELGIDINKIVLNPAVDNWLNSNESNETVKSVFKVVPETSDFSNIYISNKVVSQEYPLNESQLDKLKETMRDKYSGLVYLSVPENIDIFDLNIELESKDFNLLEVTPLTVDNVEDYYQSKGLVQKLYNKNVPIAFDQSNGQYVTNLYRYINPEPSEDGGSGNLNVEKETIQDGFYKYKPLSEKEQLTFWNWGKSILERNGFNPFPQYVMASAGSLEWSPKLVIDKKSSMVDRGDTYDKDIISYKKYVTGSDDSSPRWTYKYFNQNLDGTPLSEIPSNILSILSAKTGKSINELLEYDSVLINLYPVGRTLGWHTDVSEDYRNMDKDIISVSVGSTGTFEYANTPNSFVVGNPVDKGYSTKSMKLESGDVISFGGKSRLISHTAKDILPDNKFGRIDLSKSNVNKNFKGGLILDNSRINFTFRNAKHKPERIRMDDKRPLFNQLPSRSNKPTMTYAGIGSRNTPSEIQEKMAKIAKYLADKGYVLNTGDADGADAAFRKAVKAGQKNVFTAKDATAKTYAIAKEMHPKPDALSGYALGLMARNTNQVFGKNLDTPVDFVIAWTPDGVTSFEDRTIETRGTGQAIEMASRKGIPVINMANDDWRDQLLEILSSKDVKARIPQNLISGIPAYGSMQEATDLVKDRLGDNPHSIDMIEAGLRTRTTRSKNEMDKYNISVGDIVEHFGKSKDGSTKKVKAIVTAIHPKGSPEFESTWYKEGWTQLGIDAIRRYRDGAAAIEFRVISDKSSPVVTNDNIVGEEISSYSDNLAFGLTNPTHTTPSGFDRSNRGYKLKGKVYEWSDGQKAWREYLKPGIEFNGKRYKDVEEAYQKNKTQSDKDYQLMVDLLEIKLSTYPKLIEGINSKGGSDYILNSTHQPTSKNSKWETGGSNWFIKALNEAYNKVSGNQPTTSDLSEAEKIAQQMKNESEDCNS